ncbi:MAG: hypothetical protein AAB367_01790 [Patescibacteria group bacterium]
MKTWLQRIAFMIGIVLLTTIFHVALTPRIPDADSLYHIRHAWLYGTQGFGAHSFPWMHFSAISTYNADLWYGFHLLLVPFTYTQNLLSGLELSGIFLTSLLLIIFGFLLERHRVRLPYLWPFVLFFIVPNVLFYFLMVRPHILSLVGGLVLLSGLVRRQTILALLAGLAITFFHLSYFWFGPLIVGAYLCTQYAMRLRVWRTKDTNISISWLTVAASLTGIIVGILLRPEFGAGLTLAYIQIVQLFIEKLRNTPLVFGIELSPMSIADLFRTSFLFLILWTGSVWATVRTISDFPDRKHQEKHKTEMGLIGTSAVLSLLFFLFTITVAIRFFVPWIAFGTIVIASAYSKLTTEKKYRRTGAVLVCMMFIFMVPFALWRHSLNTQYVAHDPNALAKASLWLQENSREGDIVFHLHWDEFAELFFHNQKNYYIGGMDPIFQFAYNPELYWKFHYLSINATTEKTCGLYPCRESQLVDTYDVLTKDFNASYILVEQARNPTMFAYLSRDMRYERVYADTNAIVFSIKK